MRGYVYILEDGFHKYYIGSTIDVSARMKRHLSGYVHTTSRMKNLIMVLSQEFETIEQARKIEQRLKKLKRKDYIEKIVKDGFIKLR